MLDLILAVLTQKVQGGWIRSTKPITETKGSHLQCDLISPPLLCLIEVLQDAASPGPSPPPKKPPPAWSPHDKETPPYKTQLQTIQTIYRSLRSYLCRGPAAGRF